MDSRRSPSPGTSKPMTSESPPTPTRTQSRSPATVEDVGSLSISLFSYFKKAVVIMAVWVAGVYRVSPSWFLLALAVYVWKQRQQALKKRAIAVSQEIARDERGAILSRIEDLPPWVYFPDVERAEWVNKMIDRMWPFVGQYVHKLLKESVEPNVRDSLPASLGSFKFSKIDLGDIPPRIGGVKVYTVKVRKDEIYLDLNINYASDSSLAVQVKGMNFGVKDLTLRGTLRVIFRPLINNMPLIGGMTIFFLNNPELNFDLTNMASALDLPGLSDMLHMIIEQQISDVMVLPNRIPIQIANDVDIRKLRYPMPQGVVQVRVIEAQDLIAADSKFLGRGKSDPYAVITVGSQMCQTKVIENTCNPAWDQTFEYVIDEELGQMLKVEVKDHDKSSKDDPLGCVTLDTADILQYGTIDEWLPLGQVSKGIVHLKATWLYLSNDPAEFAEVDSQLQEMEEDNFVHRALLIVNLDSALDLPRGQGTLQEPSPFALLTVGQVTQESSIRAATTDPCWEQNFRFFVSNPTLQSLDIEVRDGKSKKQIGEMRLLLKNLMSIEDMFMERKFHLKSSEPQSSVYMSVVLRILTPTALHGYNSSHGAGRSKVVGARKENQCHPHNPDAGATTSTVVTPDPITREHTAHLSSSQPISREDAGNVTSSQPISGEDAGHVTSSQPISGEDADHVTSSQPISAQQEGLVTDMPSTSVIPSSAARRRTSSSVSTSSVSREKHNGDWGLGRVQLTLRYSTARQQLIVVLHQVCNLSPGEGEKGDVADPYVNLYLLPERESKNKRKTDVMRRDLNPVFDAYFEYPLSACELRGGVSLEVSVKNSQGVFSAGQKLLGRAVVDLSSLDTSHTITLWLDLAPPESVKPSILKYD